MSSAQRAAETTRLTVLFLISFTILSRVSTKSLAELLSSYTSARAHDRRQLAS